MRSTKKGWFIAEAITRKLAVWTEKLGPIPVYSRASTITPDCVGKSFKVHNGRNFVSFSVTAEMIGTNFGQYSETRKFKAHGGKAAKTAKR